ncbi:MAG TPA: ATP-binding protein [Thermoanaerobaculia bacterium]|nr:ATP-binding protein [Thermoanaerobaculia bacterium]
MRDPLPHFSLAATLLLLLPTDPLIAAVAVGGLGLAVLATRLPRREKAMLASGLLVAAGLVATGAAMARFDSSAVWARLGEHRLARLVEELEQGADRAVEAVRPVAAAPLRVEAFDRLDALVGRSDPRRSYLLFDQDGEAVAWAGEGLLHDVDPLARRREETGFVSSYTATTIYTLRQVGERGQASWWVLSGRSFPRDRLPFSPGPTLDARDYRWWIESDDAAAAGGSALLRSGRGFGLRVQRDPDADATARSRTWAAVALGVALFAVALERGRAAVRSGGPRAALVPGVIAVAGVATLARAGGATLLPLAILAAVAVVAAVWLAVRAAGAPGAPTWPRAIAGAGLPLGAAWCALLLTSAPDLGERLAVGGAGLALRTAVAVLGLAVLVPPHRPPLSASAGRRAPLEGLLAASLALLLGAGAASDHTAAAVALLLAGGATAIVALGRRGGGSTGRWMTIVVVACLLAAVSWELSYRRTLRARWERDLVAIAEPALETRGAQLADQMKSYLASPRARKIAAVPTTPDARQDLAVALWQGSPLARRDVASAVEIESDAAEPSLFSYGLAIREGEIDPESLPPAGVRAARWTRGSATLDAPRGPSTARFWIVPLAAPVEGVSPGELVVDLLRGDPAVEATGLAGGAALAVHAGERALLLPWARRTVPESGQRGVADTPEGRAWYWSARRDDVTYTVYLPRLTALRGLERVGIHAVGTLLAAGALAGFGLLLVLGDDAFRGRVKSALRSYSRRLILILTVLIVLPLLLLDAVLFRALDDRLEAEHRKAAEVALVVSQRVLSDYLLAIEPGFGIRTVLEQEVLDWLAQVVDREVNVYWGSQSFASSRPELFTAGLLPTRIPGDVFSELALRQDALAARTRSAAGRTYLELYAPLDIGEPDAPLDRRFYLSTPLLAQEEEVSGELARLVRRVVVVTVALLLLVLAVGARLAAGFTRPVMEIVEGTGRIARGATSLGLRPTEPELRTLVAAIDEMARRVAQSRAALLREKQVVEKMVESITAAVVSVDHDRRVIMHNQVAATLLRAEVGVPIVDVAAAAPIEGLEGFLGEARGAVAPIHRRLRSAGAEDREWSVVWVPVPGGGDPAALLVVEDVTEILRAQRLEAWAEMARIIAHEVKNPLTPIRLSTEHMQQVFASDPERFREVFERCTRNILLQVEELRAIASEFSTYSRVPHMDLRPGDLVALARSVTGAYQAAPPPGVGIVFESAVEEAPARFDEKLLARALRNLLENAVRASRDRGTVEVRVDADDGAVAIEVSDRGPGVRAEDMTRIFEPYFSTYDAGTGLGLPIARRIVEVHGGTISAANRVDGGLSVRITIPLSTPS